MGRKSKEQLALEERERSLQELADTACEVLDKKKVELPKNDGRFKKGNTAGKQKEDLIVEDGSDGSEGYKEAVRGILEQGVAVAAENIVRRVKNSKTPMKERNDLSELIITMLYGKAPLDNNIDTTINVILDGEAKKLAE